MPEKVYIDKRLFKVQDPLTLLMYGYALNPKAVTESFSDKGYVIESVSDLPKLANAAKTKGDVSGVIRDNVGRPLYFNVMETLKQSRFKKKDFNKVRNGLIQFV